MKTKEKVQARVERKDKDLYSPVYPVEFPFIEKYSPQPTDQEYKDDITKALENQHKPAPIIDPEIPR